MYRIQISMFFFFLLFAPFSFDTGSYMLKAASDKTWTGVQDSYRDLRKMTVDFSRYIKADSLTLVKDAGKFIFLSGDIYFFKPVKNRVVAGIFFGRGIFRLMTEDNIEKYQFRRFTRSETVEFEFNRVLFFFSDSTYEELASESQAVAVARDDDIEREAGQFRDKIRQLFFGNIDSRLIAGISVPGHDGFFKAYIDCTNDREFCYAVEPYNCEAVTLDRYKKNYNTGRADAETWYSGILLNKDQDCRMCFDAKVIDIDCQITSKEKIRMIAKIMFVADLKGSRIVPIRLAPECRVESVLFGKFDSCFFIQEDEKKDGQLWVEFPFQPARDSVSELCITYSAKSMVEEIGGDNYVVRHRSSWYPSFQQDCCDPVRFVMKFSVPEKMTLLSTGKLVRAWDEDDRACSIWDSERDYTVAGFNYGKFSTATQKDSLCEIVCYTNVYLSRVLSELEAALEEDKILQGELMMLPQELTTDKIGKNAAIESRNAYHTYLHFFGDIPFKAIKVSQQPQTSFGQCWPTLVYIPFTAFFSESVRERLGLVRGKRSVMWYESVVAHEIAHHWWGHTVFNESYHDDWMSEGFSTYATALYMQAVSGTERFKDYLKMLCNEILAKGEGGKRVNDVGPICLGYRLAAIDNPDAYRLVYGKGAYVLHMLRMMLFDYNNRSDESFISMMQDYLKTYKGRTATTEQFQAIVEKHFGCDMGWFFDQWVYGTELPSYTFKHNVSSSAGMYKLTVTLKQDNVSPSFKMPFHFLVKFKDSYVVGRIMVEGSQSVTREYEFEEKPSSVEPNPWNAILCEFKK